jgi:hypothetical protein
VVRPENTEQGSGVDIEEFYEQDERRRRSEEIEFGTDWTDARGVRYQVSWVADTGELYVMREPLVKMAEDPFGDLFTASVPTDELSVAVLGWVPSRAEVETLLSGWEAAMGSPDGVSWLAERLREQGVPRAVPGP